jgi:hypothetical protein
MKEETNATQINRRRNAYAANCDKCSQFVEAEAGYLFLMRGSNAKRGDRRQRARGVSVVRCESCTLGTESVKREMKKADAEGEQYAGSAYNLSHACHGN